jgi:hypothetical protein
MRHRRGEKYFQYPASPPATLSQAHLSGDLHFSASLIYLETRDIEHVFPPYQPQLLMAEIDFPHEEFGFPIEEFCFPHEEFEFPIEEFCFPHEEFGFPIEEFEFPHEGWGFPIEEFYFPHEGFEFPIEEFCFPHEEIWEFLMDFSIPEDAHTIAYAQKAEDMFRIPALYEEAPE